MAKHNEIGQKGEKIAEEHLRNLGFEILETNWRVRRLEVDIIAKDGKVLVFVEVKTRSSDFFGKPEEFVTPDKEKNMAKAAAEYMALIKHEWAIRFDVVSVLMKNEKEWKVELLKDAFFPGLG
ncbi:MAG TPA: YraN family protein [Bacteroidetes bacterium]|nr:YraN family protein [Bacteroidota bacterium]